MDGAESLKITYEVFFCAFQFIHDVSGERLSLSRSYEMLKLRYKCTMS